MAETYRENMCVLLIDNGMVDDHLPNNVLSALKAFKEECGISFQMDEIRNERKQQENFRARVRGVSDQSKMNEKGFVFMTPGSPPSSASDTAPETSRRRTTLKKQKSFDGSMDMHPPLGSAGIVPDSRDLKRVAAHHQDEVFTCNDPLTGVKDESNIPGQKNDKKDGGDIVDSGAPSDTHDLTDSSEVADASGPKLTLLERRQGPRGKLKLNLSGESKSNSDP